MILLCTWLKLYSMTMPAQYKQHRKKEAALAWGSIFLKDSPFGKVFKNKSAMKRKILVQVWMTPVSSFGQRRGVIVPESGFSGVLESWTWLSD